MEALVNELKKLWYVYYKTVEAVEYEVARAYLRGDIDEATKNRLAPPINLAVKVALG